MDHGEAKDLDQGMVGKVLEVPLMKMPCLWPLASFPGGVAFEDDLASSENWSLKHCGLIRHAFCGAKSQCRRCMWA